MIRLLSTVMAPGLLTVVLTGCTWVSLTAEGETVELMEASAVTRCERIGRATATTTDEVIRVDRSGERMQNELLILARNEAGAMGGNAIVPETVIQEGRQVFIVYRCP
ncbi:MAG: hypothetical protein PsegKO_25240 [Pseudohongiellaceae bacterium]